MNQPKDTLYQRVLGQDFTHLPQVLRDFHGSSQGGQARGVVDVRHGCGFVRRTLAKLLRLPPEGEHIGVHLRVEVEENREIWTRHFNNVAVRTFQWQRENLLIEKAGPLCFAFHMSNDEEVLRFDFSHNEIAGIKLPFALLRVDAEARSLEKSWQINVTIRGPLLGVLAQYCGEITPC